MSTETETKTDDAFEEAAAALDADPAAEPADDAELRDLSRALEAEPESHGAYEALATACARKGHKPPLDRKPVSLLTAAEVLAHPNPYPSGEPWSSPSYQRYRALAARKEEVDDELAAARVLARKGQAPDPSWKTTPGAKEDPRLAAWKSIAWDRMKDELGEALELPEKCPSLERLVELERAAERSLKLLRALREHHEREIGA